MTMTRSGQGRQMKPGLGGSTESDMGKSNDTERESGGTDFNPSDISEEEMDEGSSRLVKKGMEDEGRKPNARVSGSIVGDGDAREPSIRGSHMGHTTNGGPAKISGSHMGSHGGSKEGSGFEAGASKSREKAGISDDE